MTQGRQPPTTAEAAKGTRPRSAAAHALLAFGFCRQAGLHLLLSALLSILLLLFTCCNRVSHTPLLAGATAGSSKPSLDNQVTYSQCHAHLLKDVYATMATPSGIKNAARLSCVALGQGASCDVSTGAKLVCEAIVHHLCRDSLPQVHKTYM